MIRIIRRPILTEKNTSLNALNTYVFEVDPRATKTEIKNSVETMFKIHVEKVRTSVRHGKIKRVGMNYGRLENKKKAFVKVRDGETIELVKGL